MMEVATITELINAVGFPIVACAAMFYMNIHILKQQRAMLEEMKKAVSHNTQVMQELAFQIGRT